MVASTSAARVILVAVVLISVWSSSEASASQNTQNIPLKPKIIPQGPNTIFLETFDDESWEKRWVKSDKEDYTGEWRVSEGEETFATAGDKGLEMMSEARKHAISVKLPKAFDFTGKKLVLQYEFRIQERMLCGGAYIKLFPSLFGSSLEETGEKSQNEFDPHSLDNNTPYIIMFGPDRCGELGRVHFIYQYRNKLSGQFQESQVWPAVPAEWLESSPLTHLYRMELDTVTAEFKVLVDNVVLKNGTLDMDFVPRPEPPQEIVDVTDVKPADWVDDAEMDDPEDVKPANWDVPAEIVDPESTKPLEWDDESDGDWEPAMIPNPDYNGPWAPRRIPNPAYKGKWAPRKIPNPHYYEEEDSATLYAPVGGLGFELWSMQAGFMFNNILLTTDPSEADALVDIWEEKFLAETKIKDDIDWESSPPWYRRWVDNALEFSQESPLIFASMLITLALPLVFWAIINTKTTPKKAAENQPTGENREQQKDETPKSTDKSSAERRKMKKD